MIKALIVDDERHCCNNLQWLIKKYCHEIHETIICISAKQALEEIKKQEYNLIFLDVEMPGMSGFEMLEKIIDINFDIVFTTAFNQYAIRAIKLGALDYLVKPIDKDELRNAVDKVTKRTQDQRLNQLTALLTHINKNNNLAHKKVALPTLHGYEFVDLNNIMYCESSNNYTTIKLNNGKQILISRTLKDMEESLGVQLFYRVHNSYLVNLHYVIRYTKGDGGSLVLSNDIVIPVSRNRKDELLKLITQF